MPNWWKTRDTVFISLLTLAGLAVGAGFLFRDRSFLNENLVPLMWGRAAILIVWGLTFFAFWLAFGFYIGFRSKKLSARNACFILFTIFGLGVITYLPISEIYNRNLSAKEPFHSFLQLIPPPEMKRKSPDELLIACLGGSTTEYKDVVRWTELVEEDLRKRFPEKAIRVVNQGKAWYTTQHSLINFEFNVRHTQPDIVVLMHGINDLMANAEHSYFSEGTFRQDYGHFYGSLSRFRRLRTFAGLVSEARARSWYFRPRQVLEEATLPGIPVFQRNLERFVQLARIEGATPVLMTQATLYKTDNTPEEIEWLWLQRGASAGPTYCWNHRAGKDAMERLNGKTRQVAEETNTVLVDLEPIVPKDLEYLKDDCHLSKAGHEKVASEVANALALLVEKETS